MENKTENNIDRKGQTITFYSYKGGVGRSMALVNIACLVAKENKKILLVDCDLEAPGLHQFFKTSETDMGFVDLVTDAGEWINEEEKNNEEGYCRFMAEHLYKYIVKDARPEHSDTDISVDLMKAGKFDKDYSVKLGNIRWLEMYKKAPAFFRTFANWLEKDYDYIFIDARTGLADTSGICTMLMPQKLVLVFALNNQNINGVIDVARQAIEYRFSSSDHRVLDVYPLPSRIENSVNPNLQIWIDNYKNKFVQLFKEKYLLDECSLAAYFDRCFIQYYAIHAYGENIPSLYESASSSNFITYNYNNFLTVLKKNIPAWEIISLEDELKNERLANEHFKNGLEAYYKKEFELAIEKFTKAVELKSDYANAYFNRGLAYNSLKNYENALTDYNMVIELQPDAADAFLSRGAAKYNCKKYDEAIADYNKALEIKPDYLEAYYNLGLGKAELKKYEEALANYNKAIELKPDYADAYNNRGLTKADMKKYEDAIVDYSKAIELKPDYPDAYNNRGVSKYWLKKYQEAIADYSKALELKPDYSNVFYNRGLLKSELKKYEEAIPDFNKAMELKPDDADAYISRGMAKSELKNYQGAIDDLNKAIELKPGDAESCISRGNAKYGLEKYEEAIADYNKALELRPDYGTAFHNKACAYRKLKDFESALSNNEKCLSYDSNDSGYWALKAEILSEMGDDEGFYEKIDKAMELGFDILKEIEAEAEVMNKYVEEPRFQELLKKHKVELNIESASVR